MPNSKDINIVAFIPPEFQLNSLKSKLQLISGRLNTKVHNVETLEELEKLTISVDFVPDIIITHDESTSASLAKKASVLGGLTNQHDLSGATIGIFTPSREEKELPGGHVLDVLKGEQSVLKNVPVIVHGIFPDHRDFFMSKGAARCVDSNECYRYEELHEVIVEVIDQPDSVTPAGRPPEPS